MPLHGIDVSAYQPTLDFARVPMDFVIVKATGGVGYENPLWRAQCNAAGESGVLRQGLYHFAGDGWQGTTARDEANYFTGRVGSAQKGKVLVLDWEQESLLNNVGWAVEFCNRVADWSGRIPVVYANGSALSRDLRPLVSMGTELWHAWYGYDETTYSYSPHYDRPLARHWGAGLMWQFTQKGRLPGYNGDLDLNRFYGDAARWDSLVTGRGIGGAMSTTEDDPFMKELMG